MPKKIGKRKRKKNNSSNFVQEVTQKCKSDGCNIDISIAYNINIGNKEIHVEQRAEGGGQINKHVGTNANQGGQNAIDHSESRNDNSKFADGNGRSGIAGNDNDEAGGQQGIKVRDSIAKESIIGSSSEHSEGPAPTDEDTIEEEQ